MVNDRNHYDYNGEPSREMKQAAARIASDRDILALIGPAVQQTVSQYQSLLRHGLEQEVRRIVSEFEQATLDIEPTIIERVKARLIDVVQDEVRRVFDETLAQAERSLPDPRNGRGLPPRRPLFSNQYWSGNADRNMPEPPRGRPSYDDGHDRTGDDDWGGGSRNRMPPRPDAPPSFWVVPESPGRESHDEPETPRNAQRQQPAEEQDAAIRNMVEAVVALEDDEVQVDENEIYEGTVRLNVEANGCIREMVHFVRELRQKPQLRLLRLVGNNKQGVDIWLGLREPLLLRKMLPQIEGVTVMSDPQPNGGASGERLLNVRLTPMRLPPGEDVESKAEAEKQPVVA